MRTEREDENRVLSEKDIEDLTLLLIYLTSWDENFKREYGDKPILRAWKGYRWEVLDALTEKGLISGSKGRKSVYLTEKGIEQAKKIMDRFFKSQKSSKGV